MASAAECFRLAKSLVDKLLLAFSVGKTSDDEVLVVTKEEVMKLAKVCVGNSLFLHKISRSEEKEKKGEKLKVELDWPVHHQFCSIKIT